MHLIFISVLCSVTVSVMIKLARRYSVNVYQMIAWNYPIAAILSYYFFKPDMNTLSLQTDNMLIYAGLGFLLPAIFLAIAGSIRYTGIVRTEIAQRLSLIVPLIASFWLFKENATIMRLIGVGIGLIAILFSLYRKGYVKATIRSHWLYPTFVFFGMGIIDILFKLIAQLTLVPYGTSLFLVFCLSAIASFLYIGVQAFRKKMVFSLSGTLWGFVLGLFNFANIIFYMHAHRSLPENPSIVFSAMNIGVIVVGALVGSVVFKERLSKVNQLGLLLAIISVFIISLL